MTGPCSVINVVENKWTNNSFFLKYELVPTVSDRVWKAAYGDHALKAEILREAGKVAVCSNVHLGLNVEEHRDNILAWGL
jgi:hypothetical protein